MEQGVFLQGASVQELRQSLRAAVMERIDLSRETGDGEILELIDEEITALSSRGFVPMEVMRQLRRDLFHSIRRLDILEQFMEDPSVTEIMVNGPRDIFLERNGRIERYPGSFSSEERLEDIIQQIVADCDRVVNAASPVADARLRDGSRVCVVLPPVSLDGPALTIRRFPAEPVSMDRLLELRALSPEICAFLGNCVRAGMNIFISGGTGAGKTTFLNALSEFIRPSERLITIEDNAELQIRHVPDIVRLEARRANVEGCAPVTIRDLIRASLRMRPDRIIVGEVRGPEAVDMLQAMNTGHDGSMSTGHANSAADMIARLETCVLWGMDIPLHAVRRQISSAIELIVHLGRLRDGSRKVLEVAEVRGMRDGEVLLETLYAFRETGTEDGRITGCWEKRAPLANEDKLRRAGLLPPAEGGAGMPGVGDAGPGGGSPAVLPERGGPSLPAAADDSSGAAGTEGP